MNDTTHPNTTTIDPSPFNQSMSPEIFKRIHERLRTEAPEQQGKILDGGLFASGDAITTLYYRPGECAIVLTLVLDTTTGSVSLDTTDPKVPYTAVRRFLMAVQGYSTAVSPTSETSELHRWSSNGVADWFNRLMDTPQIAGLMADERNGHRVLRLGAGEPDEFLIIETMTHDGAEFHLWNTGDHTKTAITNYNLADIRKEYGL